MKRIVSKKKKPDIKLNIYNSIYEAISIAEEGDKILIEEGIYEESLYVSKNISLIGNGKVEIIYGDNNIDNTLFVSEQCSIENLNIKANKGSALHIYACHDVIIQNCEFYSKENTCITLTGSSDYKFKNCKIYGEEICIYYTNMFDSIGYIENCDIESKNKYAIKNDKFGKLYISNSELSSILNSPLYLADEAQIKLSNCNLKYSENLKECKLLRMALESNIKKE